MNNIILLFIIIFVVVLIIRFIFKTLKWALIIGLVLLFGFFIYSNFPEFFTATEFIDKSEIEYKYGCESEVDCAYVIDNGESECEFLEESCNYVNLREQECNLTKVNFNLDIKCKCKSIVGKKGYCSSI